MVFCSLTSMAQVGIGTTTPNANAALDVLSTSQGILLPRMTTAQRDAIASPAKGLTIFNTNLNCIQTNIGTTSTPNWKCFAGQPSTNGTGVVSAYDCSTASAGTMTEGVAVSGVTQTITATVTTVGTYSISNTSNGVTFAASGTFAGTGAQNIVLTATGTPTAAGSNSFTLNTTPNCSFSRTTLAPLPGNITLSAITPYFVASVYDQDYLPYNAPTAAASLATAQAANGTNETTTLNVQGALTTTGVTLKIPYTVVTSSVSLPAFTQTINVPASFTEDNVARDVTFSYPGATLAVGSGTINATLQAVGGTLNAKKLDLQTGIGNDNLGCLLAQFTYSTNNTTGTANFQFRNIAAVPDRNIADANHVMFYMPALGADGKTWLNNNLGADYANTTKGSFNPATQASSSTDANAYGSLFQWGRYSDGHELINRSTGIAVNASTSGTSTSITPGISNLHGSGNWYTGTSPTPASLWQGVSGTNNPCPIGYRLPTETELNNQRLSWTSLYSAGALASPLKLPMAGYRYFSDGSLTNVGTNGVYWSSSVTTTDSYYLSFTSSAASMLTLNRTPGSSVRCIANDNTSNGTAIVSDYNCSTASAGTMTAGTAVSGITQTITATVTTLGTYSISAIANGVTFAASGTFAGTGNQTIVLTATGTPTYGTTNAFSLNTTPNCSFNRTTTGNASSNGSAIVSGYTCTTASAGILKVGTQVSGVTQTITATVGTVGTYSISTTANGVTFAGAGTFAGTGAQNIVLTATGTPTAKGSNTYTLNTTPNCNFSRYASVTACYARISTSPDVFKDFLCHNLGADITLDPNTPVVGLQGAHIQWGRRGPNTTGDARVDWQTAANTANFAAAPTSSNANGGTPAVWSATAAADNSWLTVDGAKTANDPCPTGYRVPTSAEWTGVNTNNTTSTTGTFTNSDTNYGAALHYGPNASTKTLTLPAAGVRSNAGGTLAIRGSNGYYEGSSVNGANSFALSFAGNIMTLYTNPNRTSGLSLRCIEVDNPSTNGTAVVSGYTCNTASAGTMTTGTAVSGVTQTITATVTTVGTYGITATANGVTFTATGTFAGTGNQTIVLTATGTPTAAGTNSFTLNTTPSCSITRTVTLGSLPANIALSAISPYFVASVFDQDYLPYTAPTAAASLATAQAANGTNETTTLNVQGSLTTTGVTLKIPYTVSSGTVSLPAFSQTINVPASYTEDGIARDVSFSYVAASLTGTGTISVTLQAIGGTLNAKKLDLQTGIGNDNLGWLLAQFTYATNSSGGIANFAFRDIAPIPDRNIADANHVMFYLPLIGADGKTWLNNNLGANYANTTNGAFNPAAQASSSTDFNAYGSHYQWGRYSDGHELMNWSSGSAGTAVNASTSGTSTSTTPGISNLHGSSNWYTGTNPTPASLWQGVNGTNNPCPIGFRLPTETELTNQRLTWSANTSVGALASPLKLTNVGGRLPGAGGFGDVSTYGHYWSSTVNSTQSRHFDFNSSNAYMFTSDRAYGFAIRCIGVEDLSTNGTAVVSAYSCSTASAGTMTTGIAVSGVTQTLTATVTTVGTYSISTTTANGVTFTGSGTFSATGAQNIVLTATGTPTATGTNSFTLNTSPNCSFSRTTVAPLPANITLSAITPYFIASVYDQDYLPYTAPTAAASLTTPQAANGTNETPTLDTQGSLMTSGVTLKIPYTVVTASVTLPAYTQTINVPASFTEDGNARDVTFSYSGATLAVGSGTINATLQAVGNTLNAKKLDMQTGIGNDNLGWLLAQFSYALNSSGGGANFQFRNIAAIPDRNIADANHVMFYMPVLGADGKTWLNNDLGANYANTLKTGIFNPAAQATGSTDWNAYGSLFQWGRYSDGHELVNWTSGSAGTAVNAPTTGQSSSTTPGNSFLSGSSNWYTGTNPTPASLWQGVNGTNNPCPIGYRLPTDTELDNQRLSWVSLNSAGAIGSPLKLPMAGNRAFSNGSILTIGGDGYYWSSTVSSTNSRFLYFLSNNAYLFNYERAFGFSVRCMKD